MRTTARAAARLGYDGDGTAGRERCSQGPPRRRRRRRRGPGQGAHRPGQPPTAVASGLTAIGLLNNAVLFLLPVLTIPALIIGPPPARQLQLGLVVSVILAAVIVTIGVSALTWPRILSVAGRGIGRIVHLVRRKVTPAGVADGLLAQRDRIAEAFHGRWWRSVFAMAASRMFDYASLVAALVAFGAHARPAEVLLAFVVAQAFAIVPITPGGVGSWRSASRRCWS